MLPTTKIENSFLWSRYGARAESRPVACQKSEPEPELVKSRNRNLSKVGTGTVKIVTVPQAILCAANLSEQAWRRWE